MLHHNQRACRDMSAPRPKLAHHSAPLPTALERADAGAVLILLSQKVAVSTPVESVFVEIHISLGAEMNHRQTDDSESRFAGYVEGLASVIGHKDREGPLRDYCTGLLMPCERKSVEPMAAITA